ncbi:MAG: phosphotransferase family protein [Oscillospiraceae bacterium]
MTDKIIAVRTRKTIYREGDTVVKVFDKDYAKYDVLNEALNQARVENIGINVPKIIEVKTVEDGKWAIVSEFIAGKTLSQLMKENPDKKDEYIEMLVDLQIKVLSLTCPMLNKLKDKMNRKINEADLDATVRYELHTRLESMPKHTKVCHGDFCPANIIVKDDGTPYIIDWAHATQGNAAADAARTYLVFCLNGDEDAAEKYLAMYCEKSNTAKQYIQKWLPIVAASQSVKGNPNEREFLLNWVNVVEYD